MHWLDRAAAAALSRQPRSRRVFRDGWGDRDDIEWFRSVSATSPPISDVAVTERPARRSGGTVIRDLAFDSPLERLPDTVRRVNARMLAPESDADRVVVLMPAWNDAGYRTRGMLARLLVDRGIAAVMPEAPFYGRRSNGEPTPLARVSDFGIMGRGAVLEGRALLAHLAGRGYRVGVSGYSMGGNLAAFVATMMPFPVAAAPLAAAFSPAAPFLDGILRLAVDWDALGGKTHDVTERLRRYLLLASVLRFEPAPHVSSAVLMAGTVDGFIPTASVQRLHRHWPGSRLDWVSAGHGSLMWRKKHRLVNTIEDSFDRAEMLS